MKIFINGMNVIKRHVEVFIRLNLTDQERRIINYAMNKYWNSKVIQNLNNSANRNNCRSIFNSNFRDDTPCFLVGVSVNGEISFVSSMYGQLEFFLNFGDLKLNIY